MGNLPESPEKFPVATFVKRKLEAGIKEEPENGVHPLALEGIRDSLSSAYEAQVLVTTHSPSLLALVEPPEILCFDKNAEGASDIVRGSEHPLLRDWRGSIDKAVLFAGLDAA